jgi:hypothetical protein
MVFGLQSLNIQIKLFVELVAEQESLLPRITRIHTNVLSTLTIV